VTSELRFTEKS